MTGVWNVCQIDAFRPIHMLMYGMSCLGKWKLVRYLRNSLNVMKVRCSLPCSQQHVTGLCSHLVSVLTPYFLHLHFNIIPRFSRLWYFPVKVSFCFRRGTKSAEIIIIYPAVGISYWNDSWQGGGWMGNWIRFWSNSSSPVGGTKNRIRIEGIWRMGRRWLYFYSFTSTLTCPLIPHFGYGGSLIVKPPPY